MVTERSPRRGGLRGELLLALLPTATVLLVLAFVEALAQQRLLFASLASSAFLIYLDPEHEMNRVRTLVLSQLAAAGIGWLCHVALGPGYLAAGLSMLVVIGAMVALDLMHPPAVSTALSFGLQAAGEHSLVLFTTAVAITAVLVGLQQVVLRLARRVRRDLRSSAEQGRLHAD
ncbi:HPP family protein [Azohydromonas australica]|uniref:HPP family protein n=1 Tax=Azohydromonas australica TaxID=364039 RepID=UPI000688C593|nr:HPP family protein [Azohydromonas australica]